MRNRIHTLYFTAFAVLISSPAFAQLQKSSQTLNTIQIWLFGICGILVTFAICFVGVKMMFSAARWVDVAPVFWGATLIGGASGIATMFV